MSIASVLKVGMFTPVGLDARETAASVRAGISRLQESSLVDECREPIVMGLVPDDCLDPLADGVDPAGEHTAYSERLLKLGGAALTEVLGGLEARVPLFVAVRSSERARALPPSFLIDLATQAQVAIDLERSAVFAAGRAGFFQALDAAVASLKGATDPGVAVVGGIDSYLDPMPLAGLLQVEKRILTERTIDGFRPGEGAAFLLISAPGRDAPFGEPLAHLEALAEAEEPGHLYSDEPYRGEGLARAVGELTRRVPRTVGKFRTVFAGFNGEFFWSKEWGTSVIRHRDSFVDEPRIEHPAECFGDAGAALPAIMTGCVSIGLSEGSIEGPVLVWASSDTAERGAACLTAAPRGA